ncbi:putative transposase [Hamadaea flava]|nr:putative transposase [Hamadaea flava]
MATPLVLDALEHAIWTRGRGGVTDLSGLVHHTDAGSQYTSIAFTLRLLEAGVDASVGSLGDAYDNALARDHDRVVQDRTDPPAWAVADPRPGRTGHPRIRRLVQPPPHSAASDLPPADFENLYDPNQTRLTEAATQAM